MQASGIELVDSNVWLALVFDGHAKHEAMLRWFHTGGKRQFAFCRVTQMALLRHLTTTTILGTAVLSQKEAWDVYDQLLQDDRITYLQEPRQMESAWRSLTASKQPDHWLWTDAYLAAFALTCDIPVTTCDRDFRKFPGLRIRTV